MSTAHCYLATRLVSPFIHGSFERALGQLAALMPDRSTRRVAPNPEHRPSAAKPTRSELFRAMQHEKWLGKPCTHVMTPVPARPKDLHRRPLQNPHA